MISNYLKVFFLMVIACLAVVAQDSGDIIYPTEDTVWKVGEHVNVTFRDTVPPKETVTIFFANDRQTTLGGGPLGELVFPFVVPAGALSKEGGKSLLLAVRRENRHLSTVDEVNVTILPEH